MKKKGNHVEKGFGHNKNSQEQIEAYGLGNRGPGGPDGPLGPGPIPPHRRGGNPNSYQNSGIPYEYSPQRNQDFQRYQCPPGCQWVQGPQGPMGCQWIQGPPGPMGPTGLQGSVGPTGQATTIFSGFGQPDPLQGENGDFYIDLNSGNFHQKQNHLWLQVGNIMGPTGAQGAQGLQGIAGIQGPTGAQGEQGLQGIQGLQGPTGAQGEQGLQGIAGIQGPAGVQGEQGLQGIAGIQGPAGAAGVQGPTGEQGAAGIQGPTGAQGAQGIQGPTGLQGVAGPTGAIGPTGLQGSPGLSTMLRGVTVALGPTGTMLTRDKEMVLFDEYKDVSSVDISYDDTTGIFTIEKVGIYYATFSIATDGSGVSSVVEFSISLNYGTASERNFITGSPVVTGQLIGQALFTVASVPCYVTLRNFSGDSVSYANTSSRAMMTLMEVSV